MLGRRDRSGRIWILFFLTALFRAAGLGVAALALLPHFGMPGLPDDPLLLAALAAAAAAALAVRGAARRGWIEPDGALMAASLLVPAAALALAMQRTGLLESPFVLLVGALVAASALALAPLANFVLLSGVSLILTFTVVATAEGLLPAAGLAEPPVTLLGIELGLLGILGYVVNGLAWQLRAQQEELVAVGHRDRATGALRDSSFRARLAGFLEQARGGGEGVALLLFDLPGGEALLSEAAVVLHEAVRGTDLAGRVGDARLAAAVRLPSAAAGPRLAARLASRLRALGLPDLRVGAAFLSASEVTPDGAGAALRLWMEAERVLAAGRVSVG